MSTPDFLAGVELRTVALPKGAALHPVGLALGQGPSALEVLVTKASAQPTAAAARSAWQARNKGRAAPLLLVVLYGDKALLCGPGGDEPPVYESDVGQADRLCREALAQADRHAALRCLRDALPSVATRLPGIRNEGFLATHELEVGARRLAGWADAEAKARRVLGERGEALLTKLGYQIERCDQVTSILRTASDGRKVAVAVLLQQNESPELEATRFSGMSPVSYALAVADRENLPYVVVQQGAKLRLYPVKVGVGVGRRGRTETYVEVHTGLLRDTDAAYLWLILSAEALGEGGSLERLLEESRRFAGNLAENLRQRVYEFVVPVLAEGLAAARGLKKPSAQDLTDTYEMAMTVLFRLLFIAYGEDKDLLPYRWNGLYQSRSLKRKALDLLELVRSAAVFDSSDSLWEECSRLFRAVAEGHREWGVPAYDGGLFERDPEISRVGGLLAEVRLPNTVMGPVLQNLLLIGTPEGLGPVDFRSLGVREFGTIYEGLLESELAVAETDLTLDREGYYRPCKASEEPVVRRNRIYLHNRSGARKASGAYFTKPFAVDHLLDHALEPALADHKRRLDAVTDADEAAEMLFDFRVSDIAMGSGHFLVAAIDRIERAFSQYLAQRPLAGVRAELARLRLSARQSLGPLADQVEIEDTQLLRRLIARRCIYGVDLNPIAVQLARVSIWIHTFLPGLPLSLLDHNLVVGNSLTGIGRVEEITERLRRESGEVVRRAERQRTLFAMDAELLVGAAREPLARLGRVADATTADVRAARVAYDKARQATLPAEALCDIVAACRLTGEPLPEEAEDWETTKERLVGSRKHRAACDTLARLQPLHFPVAFPEVFLRDRPGFDVILGNPPWDKVRFEAQQFWVTRCPGLNSLAPKGRDREIQRLRRSRPSDAHTEADEIRLREQLQKLIDQVFSLQGRGHHGHHDLAKVFTERGIRLLAPSGCLGYVLPRTSLVLGGWTDIRRVLIEDGLVTTAQTTNKCGWMFEDLHWQIKVVLVTRRSASALNAVPRVQIWPAITSEQELLAVCGSNGLELSVGEIESLSDSWVVPWFSATEDRRLFEEMRRYQRLGHGDAWIKGTADSSRWDFSGSGPHKEYIGTSDTGRGWRVLMTRHVEAYRIAGDIPFQRFVREPAKLADLKLGVIRKGRGAALSAEHPILIYRYPSVNDNTRTLIATAIAESGYLYSKGYVHGLRTEHTSVTDVLALLGYLNTFTCDWWVRRFTDRHVTLPVLSNLPLPSWEPQRRSEVAELVSVLLLRGGTEVLPGGYEVKDCPKYRKASDVDLLAAIERIALLGFALPLDTIDAVLTDFTDSAVPEGFAAKVISQRGS